MSYVRWRGTADVARPLQETTALAIIAPTGYATWGIWWRGFPYMERRGGYSGPFATQEQAKEAARSWGDALNVTVAIEIWAVHP